MVTEQEQLYNLRRLHIMNSMLMNKVLLNQLNENDIAALRDNSKVMNKVHNRILEDTKDVVDGVMFPLEGVSSYSIGYSKYPTNCINVNNPYLFLRSLVHSAYMVWVFSEEQLVKAQGMVNAYEDNKELQVPMALANLYADILLKHFTKDYDDIYSTDTEKDYMRSELWDMYPDGAYYLRDENSIYYNCWRKD